MRKNRKSPIAEIRNWDKREPNRPAERLIIRTVEDLPLPDKKLKAAYERNRQVAAIMSMTTEQIVRIWYCHYCRHIINLAECEQPDLDPKAELIDCPRCKISKAHLMGQFNPMPTEPDSCILQ